MPLERHQSLKRKSLLALIAYLVLFIAISAGLTYWIVRAPISEQLKSNLDLRADILAAHIREPLIGSLGVLDSIVSIGQVNQERHFQITIFKQIFEQIDGVVVSGGLWPQPTTQGEKKIYNSLFFNKASDGKVDRVILWNNAEAGGYDEEEWYQRAAHMPKQGFAWSPVYVDPYTRVHMITVSKPYYIDGRFAGVATVDLSLNVLIQSIAQSAARYDLGVRLTDSYYSAIASYDFRVQEDAYISQHKFADFGWVLEVVNAKRTVTEEVYVIVQEIESWMIPVLLLGLIIGYTMLNRHVISPIVDIAERLQSSKEGGILNVPYRSHDEIRYLIDAFNQKTVYLEAEKMKAQASTAVKSTFLATLSHEIRTPMNGVLGNAQLLMSDDLTSEQKKRLEVLHQSGEHMMTLLDEILDYSKIEQGFLEITNNDFSLYSLIDSISSVYQALADEKGLKLQIESTIDSERSYHGDISRIKQILFNLINNAIKFTETGYIHIQFQEHDSATYDRMLCISVIDSGIGISKEAQQKIFRPFEQAEASTTRRYGGTGLGLAIVDELVKLMGGEIKLTSEEGVGSCFDVMLPLNEATTAVKATSLITQNINFSGLKALIVEDNRVNANILESFLSKRGFECRWEVNGAKALKRLKKEHFDVILMDHHMPVMDGIETIKHIRSSGLPSQNIFILGCSADVFQQAKDKMLDAGADRMINKPIIETELNDLLYRHSEQLYQYQSENLAPVIFDTIENLLISFNISLENNDIKASSYYLSTIQSALSSPLDPQLLQTINEVLAILDKGQRPSVAQVDELTMSLSIYC